MSTVPRIAISLGASFLGFATHAGFLARLHDLGVRPVSVAGSSAGAIAAGLYAAGLETRVIREAVLSWDLRWSFARKTPWLRHYARVTFNSAHLSAMHPAGALEYFQGLVGPLRIEDLKAPTYFAAVTDLVGRRAHFLREGPLAAAMVASCCVPSLMAPLEHAGMECFDGGVAHETPIDPWLPDPEIDMIILHRITHNERPGRRFFPLNLMSALGHVHACAGEELLRYRLALAAFHRKQALVCLTVHDRPSPLSSKALARNYDMGQEQAQRLYDERLKEVLASAIAVREGQAVPVES